MDRQMLSTMKDAMAIDITELQSAERFGVLMAIFLWIYGCVSPFAGAISDRVNRKWLIVGSIFVWSLVTFLMGVAEDFNQLRILRALMGISEALYIPSALSLLADWHEGKSRSLAIGIHMTGIYMGQAVGGFGAVVAAMLSWKTVSKAWECYLVRMQSATDVRAEQAVQQVGRTTFANTTATACTIR